MGQIILMSRTICTKKKFAKESAHGGSSQGAKEERVASTQGAEEEGGASTQGAKRSQTRLMNHRCARRNEFVNESAHGGSTHGAKEEGHATNQRLKRRS